MSKDSIYESYSLYDKDVADIFCVMVRDHPSIQKLFAEAQLDNEYLKLLVPPESKDFYTHANAKKFANALQKLMLHRTTLEFNCLDAMCLAMESEYSKLTGQFKLYVIYSLRAWIGACTSRILLGQFSRGLGVDEKNKYYLLIAHLCYSSFVNGGILTVASIMCDARYGDFPKHVISPANFKEIARMNIRKYENRPNRDHNLFGLFAAIEYLYVGSVYEGMLDVIPDDMYCAIGVESIPLMCRLSSRGVRKMIMYYAGKLPNHDRTNCCCEARRERKPTGDLQYPQEIVDGARETVKKSFTYAVKSMIICRNRTEYIFPELVGEIYSFYL